MTKLFTLFVLSLTTSIYAQNYNFGWANSNGNTSASYGTSVATDSENNVYVIGTFEGTLDLDPGAGVANVISNGGQDIFIQKLDPAGNLIWVKSIGGSMNDFGWQICVDNNENILIAGSFNDVVDFDPNAGIENHTAAAFLDAFILKLTNDGTFQWVAAFGSVSADVAFVLATNTNNEVIAGGIFKGTVDFDPGVGVNNQTSTGSASDAYLLKLDADGLFMWVNLTSGASYEEYRSIAVDDNDNIYAQGVYQGTVDFDPGAGVVNETSAGLEDSFIQKFNNDGTLAWAKVFGGTGSVFGICSDIDGSGNVYTSGYFTGTADLDPGVGTANVSTNLGAFDWNIFIQKLDVLGNFVWGKMIASPSGGEQPADIVVNDAGDVFLTGYCGQTTDFDPGAGTYNLTSAGSYDFFLLQLDANGEFVWAENWGAEMPDYTKAIAMDDQGSLFLTGFFQDTVDFDFSTNVSELVAGGADYFLLKLVPKDLGFSNVDHGLEWILYPNPSNGAFVIDFNANYEETTVNVTDLTGKLVLQLHGDKNTKQLKFHLNEPPGIYRVSILCGDQTTLKKLVIQ